jgi:hypothetical protein
VHLGPTFTGSVHQGVRPPPVDDRLPQALETFDRLPLETIPDPAPLPPGSRVVLSRNDPYVGRAADLREIAQLLKGGETAAIDQTAVASGMGGIGKTQLASEFVHRYGQFFTGEDPLRSGGGLQAARIAQAIARRDMAPFDGLGRDPSRPV